MMMLNIVPILKWLQFLRLGTKHLKKPPANGGWLGTI